MRAHRTDVISLASGLFFVTVAALGLADALDLSAGTLRWGGAALLVLFGAILVATARGGRGDAAEEPGRTPTRDIS